MRKIDTLGELVKEARKKKGLTTAQLAEKVDVSQGYISHIENNRKKNPSGVILRRLSETLNIPYIELLARCLYMSESFGEQERYYEYEDDEIIIALEKAIAKERKQHKTEVKKLEDILKLPIEFNGKELTNTQKEKLYSIAKTMFSD